MNAERLAAMKTDAISLDTETAIIQPGLPAPDVVLGSAADTGTDGAMRGMLLDKPNLRTLFRAILVDRRWTVVVANGPYDFLVLAVDAAKTSGDDLIPAIFNMYDPDGTIVRGHCNGRVFDVQRAEELHAIANGHLGKDPQTNQKLVDPETGEQAGYRLSVVTQLVQNRVDAKANDRFRMRYWEFNDMPLTALPYEAQQYPVDDAINTLGDGLAQAGHLPSVNNHEWINSTVGQVCRHCRALLTAETSTVCMRVQQRRNLHDLSRQCYAAWALQLSDSWGFCIDQNAVDDLEKNFDTRYDSLSAPFVASGVLREDGSENQSVLKKKIAVAYGSRSHCPVCDNTGKVPSEKTGGKTKVNCKECAGTGLQLAPEVPRTPTDGVGTSADVLNESGDDDLVMYGQLGLFDKIKSTYIPMMRKARVCVHCNRQVGARIKKKNVEHADDCPSRPGVDMVGQAWRSVPLNPRSRPLVETGRCAVPDGLHGLPRKGGVRECFVSRKGFVMSSIDYAAGELVCHAQNAIRTVGYSRMAQALNAGLDAHIAIAATMLGRQYEECIALYKKKDKTIVNTRQGGKAGNFGYLGGMGELTFTLRKRADKDIFTPCANGPDTDVYGNRGYIGLRSCVLLDGADRCGINKVTEYKGVDCAPVCIDCVMANKRIREAFFRQWPENNHDDGYFHVINDWLENGQLFADGTRGIPGEITHHGSRRIRGGVGFTDGANGLFQGMLADIMKNAYCQIQRECYDRTWRVRSSQHMKSAYDGGESPLYGSRGQILFHDEFIGEHPESVAHDAAMRAGEIMVEAMRWMCPDLSPAAKADPALMRKLYKGVEAVRDSSGRLIPWEPS